MNRLKALYLAAALLVSVTTATAQISSDNPAATLSPYSQFGIGTLANPCAGFNAGMQGVGVGMRSSKEVNPMNPASYSAIDSLTFIFDIGAYGSLTNYKQGGNSVYRKSADLDYVSILFRVTKGLGISAGILPISHVGYDYQETVKTGDITSITKYHARHGGAQQYFLGIGWQIVKGLSVGVNGAYLRGTIERTVSNFNSLSEVVAYLKTYETKISSYKLDFGVQGSIPLGKKDVLNIGATYGLGHKLSSDQTMTFTSTTVGTDTLTCTDAYSLPHSFAVGVSYAHGNNWRVGLDYSQQMWSKLQYPVLVEGDGSRRYVMADGYYLNRHHIALGGEFCLNPEGRSFADRIRYKAGFSYSTPYVNIGNEKGPREIGASLGVGLPIINGYNNRSILNVAVQWVNTSGGPIRENSFRLKLGFTFNERWFMKWKVE